MQRRGEQNREPVACRQPMPGRPERFNFCKTWDVFKKPVPPNAHRYPIPNKRTPVSFAI
jgi:hypothetical protein